MKRYTVPEAANELGISTSLVYALLAARKLRHERIGLGRGRCLIPADALDEYRASRTIGVHVPPTAPPLPVTRERAATPALDLW